VEQVLAPEEILANVEFEKFDKKLTDSEQQEVDPILQNIKPKPTNESK